ncbi:formylglycine-generating enzyme family protein [Geminisphaera colitermitum]|uniref:formylglycine-generating enzyme family protein n=1 Tax=Geminisphaera colitermitum TaxID=1148786 RepID=UPI0009DD9C3D|nr:SUMF1/EgtB/PvdO family nonheme iron enzyme [Geminisphaera colitermitum]
MSIQNNDMISAGPLWRALLVPLAGALMTLEAVTTAFAATPGSQLITMPTVTVGDIGNVADSTGFGSVSYEYQIGKYEVTNGQYAAFLNAVDSTGANTYNLYNSNMSSSSYGGITWNGTSYVVKAGFDLKPMNYVSFYDAARFTNWLTTGDTENGLYTFDGTTTITSFPDHATSTGWAVASEDEWYKAAYYDPNKGGVGGYWAYPTQSDSISGGQANYYNSGNGNVPMEVGSFASNAYGTFDQGGNVWEWSDTLISGTGRGVRGGSFLNTDTTLASSARDATAPAHEVPYLGFRVVSLSSLDGPQVPEPNDIAAIIGVLMLGVVLMRKGGRRTL